MKIVYDVENGLLHVDSKTYKCDSLPRNELNRKRPQRGKTDIFFGKDQEGNRYASMPRPFPKGKWHITDVVPIPRSHPDHKYLGDFYVKTDAYQWLKVWRTGKSQGYIEPLQEKRLDTGYGFHFCLKSTSVSSHGCGLLRERVGFNAFLKRLQTPLKKRSVPFEVV